jgi:SAM-dependent methyltransferase
MQFAIHHLPDAARALGEVRRVLADGGRFVILTLSPRDQPGFRIYRYWPATLDLDLRRFVKIADLVAWCRDASFARVRSTVAIDRPVYPLGSALALAHDRSSSQLLLISDAEYRAGLGRLEEEWRERGPDASLEDEIALLTIVADA